MGGVRTGLARRTANFHCELFISKLAVSLVPKSYDVDLTHGLADLHIPKITGADAGNSNRAETDGVGNWTSAHLHHVCQAISAIEALRGVDKERLPW